MPETVEELKKKVDEYEKMIGIGEYDIAKNAFFAICRIADLQTKRLNKFNLETEIAKDAKEDKIYDRTKAIWEGMAKMISDINSLRKELGIGKAEVAQQFSKQMTTSETIANVLSDTGRQDA
jgi:hypothetical protein